MSLGTLVVDEVVLPITSIELKAGTLVVTATGRVYGKVTIQDGQECRIHAPDGSTVGVLTLTMPHGPAHAVGEPGNPAWLTVIQPLGFKEFIGRNAWPRSPA